MAHQEQERPYQQELLHIILIVLSLESAAHNWCKNILVKVQEWSDNYSLWQDNMLLALSSLMRLTQSVDQEWKDKEVTLKCKELCYNYLTNLMVLKARRLLKLLWLRTEQIYQIPLYCVQVELIVKLNSQTQKYNQEYRF